MTRVSGTATNPDSVLVTPGRIPLRLPSAIVGVLYGLDNTRRGEHSLGRRAIVSHGVAMVARIIRFRSVRKENSTMKAKKLLIATAGLWCILSFITLNCAQGQGTISNVTSAAAFLEEIQAIL